MAIVTIANYGGDTIMKFINELYFPDCDEHMSAEYEAGKKQFDTLELALQYVTNFDCAVDGGAFVGAWSLEMSDRFNEVFSFEPASDTFECLEMNTEGKSNIRCINSALSDKAGTASLEQDERWYGNTGGRYLTQGDDCIITKLDDYHLPKLDFLKLDVEGHEYYSLLGAKETILKYKPIILCEQKSRLEVRQGVQTNMVGDLLESFGYELIDSKRKDYIYGSNI